MYANLAQNKKNSMIAQTSKPDKRVRLSRSNQTKLCDKKVNTTQFDWVTCAESTYIFCVTVTKLKNLL